MDRSGWPLRLSLLVLLLAILLSPLLYDALQGLARLLPR